mmetsp:Transcript_74390/g.210496  ORF Transcript_74390/g.210496 Transcript_74390/m.210496 type:complete len:210 (-) Transcript_74390:22-651(-)
MAAAAPPPQVVGSQSHSSDPVANMQRQAAAHAAQAGVQHAASRARSGLMEIKMYIQENPASVKIACFVVGLILIVFSILGLFNIFNAALDPAEYLGNVYNVFFGIIICICDGKESWMKSCWDVQAKLFQYAYVLATQTGRALFYFYIGSMTILILPDSFIWSVIYIVLGSLLCSLALLMLFIHWCGRYFGCQPDPYVSFEPRPSEGGAM